jgi:muramoyltetrapeptide carboxypeptidase LdcA involved in peptidoglycan recycling
VIECLKKREVELPKRGIPLIGFSDATMMQHYLGSIGVVSPIQGTDIGQITTPLDEDGEDVPRPTPPEVQEVVRKIREDVCSCLFQTKKQSEFELVALNDSAATCESLAGQMVIFNEHSRRATYRTVTDPSIAPILLLEGGMGDGRSFRDGIPFALEHLRSQGQLENLRAIVLSRTDGNPPRGEGAPSREEQLEEVRKIIAAAGLDLPVFIGAPFGHGPIFRFQPIALHTASEIAKAEDGKFVARCDLVRTKKNCAEVAALVAARDAYRPKEAAPSVAHHEVEGVIALSCINNSFAIPSGKHDFLLCATKHYHRGCEAFALEGRDLSGGDVAIVVGFPGLEELRKFSRPGTADEELSKQQTRIVKQAMQMTMIELLKTEELQKAKSLTFCSQNQIPKELNDWLLDFSTRHNLPCALSTAKIPEIMEKLASPSEVSVCSVEVKTAVAKEPAASTFLVGKVDRLVGSGALLLV